METVPTERVPRGIRPLVKLVGPRDAVKLVRIAPIGVTVVVVVMVMGGKRGFVVVVVVECGIGFVEMIGEVICGTSWNDMVTIKF